MRGVVKLDIGFVGFLCGHRRGDGPLFQVCFLREIVDSTASAFHIALRRDAVSCSSKHTYATTVLKHPVYSPRITLLQTP